MAMPFFSTTMMPIGVACDGRYVHAVQWRRVGRRPMPHRAVSWPYRSEQATWPAEEVAHLAAVLERRGFSGRRVVLAAPPEDATAHTLELPPRSAGVPLRQLATMEAAQARKTMPDALTVDFWDVPDPARANQATHVLAVACETKAMEAMLAGFDDVGLDVVALDWPALALHRACAGRLPTGDGAMLMLGWSRSLLVIVHKGQVVYERPISDFDIRRLHDQVVQNMQVSERAADLLITGGLDKPLAASDKGNVQPSIEPAAEADAATTTENLNTTGENAPPAAERRGDADLIRQPQQELTALALSHAAAATGELRAALGFTGHRYPDCNLDRLVLTGLGATTPGLAQYMGPELEVQVCVLDAPFHPALGLAGDETKAVLGSARTLAAGLSLWGWPVAGEGGAVA